MIQFMYEQLQVLENRPGVSVDDIQFRLRLEARELTEQKD